MNLKTPFTARFFMAVILVQSFIGYSVYISAEQPSITHLSIHINQVEYHQLTKLIANQKKNGVSNAHIAEQLVKTGTPTARLVLEEFLASLEQGIAPESPVTKKYDNKGIVQDLFWATTAGVVIYWVDTKKALAIAAAAGIFLGYRLYRRFKS